MALPARGTPVHECALSQATDTGAYSARGGATSRLPSSLVGARYHRWEHILRDQSGRRHLVLASHSPALARRNRLWRGGLLFALVMDVAQHISSINGFLPIRFLILFWMKAWPVVLAVNLIAASTRRIQIGTTVAYFSIFCFPRVP